MQGMRKASKDKSKDQKEPFYLKVPLNSKTQERLAEISWMTGMPLDDVAAALLEDVLPIKENRKNFGVWRRSLPPDHPAFANANADNKNKKQKALEIPTSKRLDDELKHSAKARSKEREAAEWLQRCREKSISGVTAALRQLYQDRKDAPKAEDQVAYQLKHRRQFVALIIRPPT